MEPYLYHHLAQGTIRLVRVLPGAREEPIKCELIPYALRSGQAPGLFEALSYVWGDTKRLMRIQLRDVFTNQYQYLDVTYNLNAALRQLRDSDLPRTLWIDAICMFTRAILRLSYPDAGSFIGINQNDLLERASQVQVMSSIYNHASHVTVWLGEGTDDSISAFELLHRAAQRSMRPPSIEEINTLTKLLIERAEFLKGVLLRPWFRRVWVSEVRVLHSIHTDYFRGSARGCGRQIYFCCMWPK